MISASIGFRAKTGRAIAVALSGTDRPSFILREEVSLVDPRVPQTAQPYHVVMEMPWTDGVIAAARFVTAIEAVAAEEMERLIGELASRGYSVKHIGIVGSKDRDLAKLGNPHIRAHAAEGILFRHVLEIAAKKHRKSVHTMTDADVAASRGKLARHLKMLGVEAGSPWRADEKAAATAACLALH